MEKSKVNSNSPSLQIYGRINFFFLNTVPGFLPAQKKRRQMSTLQNYTCGLIVSPFAVLCNIDLSRLSSALR